MLVPVNKTGQDSFTVPEAKGIGQLTSSQLTPGLKNSCLAGNSPWPV